VRGGLRNAIPWTCAGTKGLGGDAEEGPAMLFPAAIPTSVGVVTSRGSMTTSPKSRRDGYPAWRVSWNLAKRVIM